jgi:hypothetical protein
MGMREQINRRGIIGELEEQINRGSIRRELGSR